MSGKRRDDKGRNLRPGESQRKDGTYDYRYTDANGKRRSIYAPDLHTLRLKEEEIQRLTNEGIDYAGGEISVLELLQRYVALKRGVRRNTRTGYDFVLGVVKPAFEMACNEDVVRRTPFAFRLDIIPNNARKRVALAPQQQKAFLTSLSRRSRPWRR